MVVHSNTVFRNNKAVYWGGAILKDDGYSANPTPPLSIGRYGYYTPPSDSQ